VNIGNALADADRPEEALTCYDEAIRVYRQLVEGEGRGELVSDLAGILVNKGNALADLGRFEEALCCFDEAVAIYRRLVGTEGRKELASWLAAALVNKGGALQKAERFEEALRCFDEAIAIYRQLVERQGQKEWTDKLAAGLMNKGATLDDLGRFEEALQCYDEGIRLWEEMMEAGSTHVAAWLLQGLGVRFELKRRMRDWQGAAEDIYRALAVVQPFLGAESPPESVVMALIVFLFRLRLLTPEEWAELEAVLGEEGLGKKLQDWFERWGNDP
jgi:tetratricopeptide (TPR) repeat protein